MTCFEVGEPSPTRSQISSSARFVQEALIPGNGEEATRYPRIRATRINMFQAPFEHSRARIPGSSDIWGKFVPFSNFLRRRLGTRNEPMRHRLIVRLPPNYLENLVFLQSEVAEKYAIDSQRVTERALVVRPQRSGKMMPRFINEPR